MTNLFRAALCATLAILVTGCSSSPKVSFYTLTAVAPQSAASPMTAVVLVGPSILPREVQRSQIITRPEPSSIKINETHRWAGSLELIFDRTVAENLERLLPSERVTAYPVKTPSPIDYRVIVDLRQFDGEQGEAVTLRGAYAILSNNSEAVAEESFEITQPTEGGGFREFVEAHNAAIAQLSAQIAARMPRQPGD